ncbi:POU domain protein [Elysia marginata]|uniref:POU domain protein n=1 Tax=Elysia marginata TaxID=1093978 RepID=A0AAV4JWW6_9GAST|nr:POU domain protein [Elysia marginata]
MKFKTVREGEQAVILNHLGEGRLVVGPQRVFLFRERFNRLTSKTADRYQYLEIQENNGSISHRPGPCLEFNDPLKYRGCVKQEAQCIDGNHVLVVYRRLKGGQAERRIIQGPAVFIPGAEEWVHEFQWHGTDPENKARMVPGLNKFTQLPTIANNFYYNVREVRTSDDTMLTVKIMMFYQMEDILKMLDTTHDPIADLINALCADVISFVGPLSYGQFVECTSQLSSLKTYPQLVQRAESVGFEVQKVVFRGYHASEQLQEMQNNAIESRTQLRLQREIEDQEQKLAALKLDRRQQRSAMEQEMAVKRQAHKQRLEELRQQHRLQIEEMVLSQKLELASHETQARLESKKAEETQKLSHLQNLSKLDVNLNKTLKLEYPVPPQEEIRVVPPSFTKL